MSNTDTITLGYANATYLKRIGIATSVASLTTFTGDTTINGTLTLSTPTIINLAGGRIITCNDGAFNAKIRIHPFNGVNGGQIVMGTTAGTNSNLNSIAIGTNAGQTLQDSYTIAIGNNAGYSSQGQFSIAEGFNCGVLNQGTNCIALGQQAGNTSQGNQSIAIGLNSGQTSQLSNAIGIGNGAGSSDQGIGAVAIGTGAGQTTQGQNSVAIGNASGQTNQLNSSVAIGNLAGRTSQAATAVSIGFNAGNFSQGNSAVAIGPNAGSGLSGLNFQGARAIAIGNSAGQTTQGADSVAIGNGAGTTTQNINAVAIGSGAGQTTQGAGGIAIGVQAGNLTQGGNAVAIGTGAGQGTTSAQGANCIAIGAGAGQVSQLAGSIALNASGGTLNPSTASTYINPIRSVGGSAPATIEPMFYNTSTKELVSAAPTIVNNATTNAQASIISGTFYTLLTTASIPIGYYMLTIYIQATTTAIAGSITTWKAGLSTAAGSFTGGTGGFQILGTQSLPAIAGSISGHITFMFQNTIAQAYFLNFQLVFTGPAVSQAVNAGGFLQYARIA